MSKRTLLSIFMVLILAIGVTGGTYAYFVATVTSNNNKLVIGTLGFKGLNGELTTSYDMGTLVSSELPKGPGLEVAGVEKTITNQGNLSMKLQSGIDWEVIRNDNRIITKKSTDSDKLWADQFKVKPVISYGGDTYGNSFVSISVLEHELNSILNGIGSLESGKSFTIKFDTRLEGTTTNMNDYQGSQLNANLTITASEI